MGGVAAGGQLEVAVVPRNEQYHPDDDRWRDQVTALYRDLNAHVDTVHREHPVAGAKGTVDEVIIALGSAGVFTAAVECLRAWLQRDKSRRLDLRWDEDGVEHFVTVSGDGVDVDSFQELARAAAARVGGRAWPAGTAPS